MSTCDAKFLAVNVSDVPSRAVLLKYQFCEVPHKFKSVEYYDRSASYVYYFHSAIGEFCAEEGYYYADSGEPQA